MTVPVGAAVRPYVQTEPVALALWLMINFASFALEFIQWQERRAEAAREIAGDLHRRGALGVQHAAVEIIGAVGHAHVAVEADAGARGVGVAARRGAVAGDLFLGIGIDLGDGAFTAVRDTDVARDIEQAEWRVDALGVHFGRLFETPSDCKKATTVSCRRLHSSASCGRRRSEKSRGKAWCSRSPPVAAAPACG